jgi:hypothetical protein
VAAPCFAFQAPRKQDIGPEDGNSIAYWSIERTSVFSAAYSWKPKLHNKLQLRETKS